MRKPAVLVTGASGEVGYGLIEEFGRPADMQIIALDIKELAPSLREKCAAAIVGDILDKNLLQRLISEFEIHAIYHLAALLSTRAEYSPEAAHSVNVEGTLNLLRLAHEQARWHGHPVTFLFPSSIAVYGLPSLEEKRRAGRLRETEWNFPTTMYGCNKSYCEHLGRYYTLHYRQLAAENCQRGVDFRAIRFPGLISALTLPTGGTSDYAAEMIHAAAQDIPYECFVSEATRIPFMVMPDAIKSLILLAAAPPERLSQRVYNVSAFSLSAGELRDQVRQAFPDAEIRFKADPPRARIVDTWPEDVDDSPARADWNWKPDYDLTSAFNAYLIPRILSRYEKSKNR
ncbi:MAG: NAD-dependent epimerase/dehydratase family protein [Phycisphaerae bacterium]